MSINKRITLFLAPILFAVATVGFTGCDNQKEIVDVETPSGELEVEQDQDTGEVDVDLDDNE